MSRAFYEANDMSIYDIFVRDNIAHVGSVLHGSSPGGNLSGVALNKSGVDGVGERELGKVFGDVLLHLVLLEPGSGLERLGGNDGDGAGLVGDGREVVVGDDLDLRGGTKRYAISTGHCIADCADAEVRHDPPHPTRRRS